MSEFSFEILLPAFRILLGNKIQKAASDAWKNAERESFPDRSECERLSFTRCTDVTTPLHRVRTIPQVWYVSAIAFKLAKRQQISPLELAQAIAPNLVEYEHDEQGTEIDRDYRERVITNTSRSITTSYFLFKIWINSTIWVTFPGWIYWQISSAGLAAWFQAILHTDLSLDGVKRTVFSDTKAFEPFPAIADLPFSMVHAHARCCSLLRSAQRQGWLGLSETPDGDLTIETPLIWQACSDRFMLNHPAEWALAMTLLDALDEISVKPTHLPTLKRQTLQVSEAFHAFHAQCPLWGEARDVRLGLVSATQRILKLLLEKGLGVDAPRSL